MAIRSALLAPFLGFNQVVDTATAEVLATPGLFVEAIVAPGFDEAALEILTTRPKWKQNVRLMEVGPLDSPPAAMHYRCIDGGLLVQQADVAADETRPMESRHANCSPHRNKSMNSGSPGP